MTVFVDEVREYPKTHGHRFWCHMASDDYSDAGLAELHRIAAAIGLERRWFQKPNSSHPHYDLVCHQPGKRRIGVPPDKRDLALSAGAQFLPGRQLVVRCRRGASPTEIDLLRPDQQTQATLFE